MMAMTSAAMAIAIAPSAISLAGSSSIGAS